MNTCIYYAVGRGVFVLSVCLSAQ